MFSSEGGFWLPDPNKRIKGFFIVVFKSTLAYQVKWLKLFYHNKFEFFKNFTLLARKQYMRYCSTLLNSIN